MIEEPLKNDYELAFLITGAERAAALLDILKKREAQVTYESQINQIKLAYPIKKQTSAFFGFYHFLASRDSIKKISDDLTLNPSVLRFLLITPPIKPALRQPKREIGEPQTQKPSASLSNEALEQKLEEILK